MSPRLSYWHLWTDTHGISHQTQCALEDFDFKGVGNPAPQWIVPLSGSWWVEAMDGTKINFGPGEISLGEDQNCREDAEGRKGHRSGSIGDQPAVLMTVRLHVPAVTGACHLK